jgi:hypothetical protein
MEEMKNLDNIKSVIIFEMVRSINQGKIAGKTAVDLANEQLNKLIDSGYSLSAIYKQIIKE